ncbi:MAG: hypothetical protein HOQ32_01075 [Lysobacter sp.]|nr:hypothetical protein [Lysobacter sp.]
MSVTFDLFTRWKATKGIESDRQALTALGVSHGAAVHWKAGRNGDAAVIEKMASDLGDNPLLMVALAMKEQSQGDAAKTWARFARQLGAAAALAFVSLLPYSQAADSKDISGVTASAHCILCKIQSLGGAMA